MHQQESAYRTLIHSAMPLTLDPSRYPCHAPIHLTREMDGRHANHYLTTDSRDGCFSLLEHDPTGLSITVYARYQC